MGFPLLLNKSLPEVKKHGLDVRTRWTCWGHVQSGQVGFPLLLNKALNCGQEAWMWGSYELHSFEEGHVHSGQVGFPFLLKKSIGRGQDAWIERSYTVDFVGAMFRVGQ